MGSGHQSCPTSNVVLKTLRCAPELLTINITGKTYLITGANSGVGLATTAQLRSPNPNAHDDKLAKKLYVESRKMVGLN